MYGTVDELADGRWRLRFTRTLAHPVDTVWKAITEPQHLVAWFPTTIEGERAAGAPLRFSFPEDRWPPFEGEVIAYEPMSAFEFRWGTDIIRLELRASDDGTVLTLLDTLDERGKAARDGAGWHTCLDALTATLAGQPDARAAMSGWADVHARYVERFGPQGATIGPPEQAG
jgi:uncharacterized protein YndB with AHSA1/START domain